MDDMYSMYSDLRNGKIKPYKLEQIIFEDFFKGNRNKWEEACKKAEEMRLKFIEDKTGKKYEHIKIHTKTSDGEKLTVGIENKIGSVRVPLGFAGPLKINGDFANGEFFIPLATNEAALIAGLNRGISAINKAGGIRTIITGIGMTRAPLIELTSIERAREIANKIKEKDELYQKVKERCESESRVSKLLDIQPFQIGRRVHLRFVFHTGDSMGMNSATRYSANGIDVLKEIYPDIKLISLTANMCTDKKSTHTNVIFGRGRSVQTEVSIPRDIIKDIYGVELEEIVKLNFLKNYQGSALAGSVAGFNANVANTIAAVFIATGQDSAQVVESSSAFINAEIMDDKLVFGAYFPSLEVATVGGGTDFDTARECLEIMSCAGPGKEPGANANKFAEIIAAAATAQDLNLLGTESHGRELADSHIKLARGK